MTCSSCKKTPCKCKGPIEITPCDAGVMEIASDPFACATAQPSCAEDTQPKGLYPCYVALLKSFNMPACQAEADIIVPDAKRFSAGQFLLSRDVGVLTISAVIDELTLRVKNECLTCGGEPVNVKEPGEVVTDTTIFSLGAPPCGAGAGSLDPALGTPFLAADFVIPAVGGCQLAKVTNTLGLFVNDEVTLAGHGYHLTEILDASTVKLCNDGDGGTANTVIKFDQNNDGKPDFPVVRIGGQNPCTATVASSLKRIVGCSAANEEVGGQGSITGQTFVWDNALGMWRLEVIPEAGICVNLATGLTLDPDLPINTLYLVDVSPDTVQLAEALASNVEAPNYLTVTINDDEFGLAEIVDSNTIRVIPLFDVLDIKLYAVGSTLCVASCCVQCRPVLDVLGAIDGNATKKEVLAAIPGTDFVLPAGQATVFTMPAQVGSNGNGSNVGDGIWTLTYSNQFGRGRACEKWVALLSNFEVSVNIPDPNIYVNIELRTLRRQPTFNTLSGAANNFMGGLGLITSLNGTPNLGLFDPNFKSINSFKGTIYDRDFVGKGVTNVYQGHVRIVGHNPTGSDSTIRVAGAWRVNYLVSPYRIPSV